MFHIIGLMSSVVIAGLLIFMWYRKRYDIPHSWTVWLFVVRILFGAFDNDFPILVPLTDSISFLIAVIIPFCIYEVIHQPSAAQLRRVNHCLAETIGSWVEK